MSPRTEAQTAELTRLRDESLALLSWLERHEPAPLWADMRAVVIKAEQSLPNMRIVARECRRLTSEMPQELREAIFAAVEAESGISLATSDATDATKAEAIFRRGRVVTDAEYYRLRSHLERVSSAPARQADVARITAILDAYSPSGRAAT